jgi:ribosomal protein S18 acetylase RimI-like enzyme
MKIRRAELQDLKELVEFEKKISSMHGKLDKFYEESGSTEREKKKFLSGHLKSRDSLVLVAEENGKIIGYILSYITKRPKIFKEKMSGHISSIYILERYQNKGVAKSLLEETYKWFKKRKIQWVELSVHTKNKSGIKFWEKSRFKTTILRMRRKL